MTAPAEKVSAESRLSEVTTLTPERPPLTTKAHTKKVRRDRTRRLLSRLAVFVILPTAVSIVYFGFIASEQFESYSVFTVQSSELRPALGMDGVLASLATNTGANHDALVVRDYLMSRNMLERLDREHGFVAHFKDKRHDFFSRLRGDASFEAAFEYFDHKVFADFDQLSGAVTVRVRAFSPDKARELDQSILTYSEEMVNKLSERERRDRTSYAEAEVNKAEQRLATARKEIVKLQQKHEDFNPLQSATATMTVRTQLEGELARARAELMQLKSFMNEGAPQVLAVNEKVKSLSAQISGENRRLVDPSKPSGLNASFADFEAAMVEKEFAQKTYESAMATLEMARADADRQHRYVAVIATPSKPDEATYPHRVRSIVAAFVLSFLAWGVGTMMMATVREHARL